MAELGELDVAKANALALLRSINFRISSTSGKQLPPVVFKAAASVWDCRVILSSPSDVQKKLQDASTQVHRFKTTISSLLQDRAIEGRWAAVVLAKAAVEAGGIELLSTSNAWVQGLLGVLKKTGPPSTRSLAIITLTRIFTLTWNHPENVRKITTPSLPSMISACLSNVERRRCSQRELKCTLDSWATLIHRHPTIFRSHQSQIRSLLADILSSGTASQDAEFHYTQSHHRSARQVLVLLHHCAPKQGANQQWEESFRNTILSSQATCDLVFRSVVENWRPLSSVQSNPNPSSSSSGTVELTAEDPIGLRPWQGHFAGVERLVSLVQLLQAHIQHRTAGTIALHMGMVGDLLTRIASVTTGQNARFRPLKANDQISKEERDEMFSSLFRVHVASLDLMSTIIDRFGSTIHSIIPNLAELVSAIFESSSSNLEIRTATYKVAGKIILTVGPSMSKDETSEFVQIVKACCDDLVAERDPTRPQMGSSTGSGVNTELFHPRQHLYVAAEALLPVVLSQIHSTSIVPKLRGQMERVATLTANKDALIACVLNPAVWQGRVQPSLLPLLAREYPSCFEVETLLRPRMPPITGNNSRVDEAMQGGSLDMDQEESSREEHFPGLDNGRSAYDSNGLTPEAGKAVLASQEDHETPVNVDQESALSHAGKAASEESVHSPAKRAASEDTEIEVSAKRLRASPVARALAPDAAAALPRLPQVSAQDPVPVNLQLDTTVEDDGRETEEHNVIVSRKDLAPVEDSVQDAQGKDSDESDFELPPLTMDSDSDLDDDSDDQKSVV